MSSFTAKQLRVTFTLNDQTAKFAGGGNQLVLTNLRTVAALQGALGFLWQLDLQIYGMLASDMNALTVMASANAPTAILKNQVLLEGNQGAQWYTLFNGVIVEGGGEYRNQPETFFHCQAVPSAYFSGIGSTQSPLSFQDDQQLEAIITTIAKNLGTNSPQLNGVSGIVKGPSYFAGAPLTQLDKLKQKSGGVFDYTIDPSNTLITLMRNPQTKVVSPRTGGTQIVLSPSSGLVAYPTPEIIGLSCVALFDPALLLGAQFQIEGSDIPKANGLWTAYAMDVALEAVKLGGGQWHASMHCMPVYQ